ncbi:DNA-3-methyladenine glycosylase 2 family protein [Candidatus Marinimicrobia bacterium]|nr:DNA-3-methyladenine glycosylase 2 family protein [Candidatus Neomarinimicrobiota bacterium]
MVIKAEYLDTLSANDPILKQLISSYPIPTFRKSDNFLHDLIKYIIFQQISTKAGNTIYNRFLEFHSFKEQNSEFKWEEKDWKKIGLSHQKKSYIENLFDKNNLEMINSLSCINDSKEIRNLLISLNGIGPWTIDMFLIFSKHDLNIFPKGDLAVINVIKSLYGVDNMNDIESIAKKWHPYQSIATLYLWESLDDDFPS